MPLDFPIYSYKAGERLLDSLQKGINMRDQNARAQYISPMLREELAQKQAQTPIMQAKLPYADQMAAAELASAQVDPKYKEAMIKEILEGKIPLQQIEAATKPYKDMGSFYSGVGSYNKSQNATNPKVQINRMINSPPFQSLINSNQEFATAFASLVANQMQDAGNPQENKSDALPDALNRVADLKLPQTPRQQASLREVLPGNQMHEDPNKLALAASFAKPGSVTQAPPAAQQWPTQQPPGQQPPASTRKPIQISDADIKKMQEDTGNALFRKTNTAQRINAQMYGKTLGDILTEAAPMMQSVASYAGIQGKIKLVVDKGASALGKTSPDYQNYLNFTGNIVPAATGEMMRELGKQMTDQEAKKYLVSVSKDAWDSNPEAAMKSWNNLVELYEKRIAKSLSSTQLETFKQLKDQASGKIPIPLAGQSGNKNPQQSNMVKVQTSDGKIWNLPSDKVDAALKHDKGAKRIS